MAIEFVKFDDPFLIFKVDGGEYCWNPEYGSLLNFKTDKLVDPTPGMREFIRKYYERREAMGIDIIEKLLECITDCPQNDGGACIVHRDECTRRTTLEEP